MHTYIYNAQEEAEMKFSCILSCKEGKHVMYVNGGRCNGHREHLEILSEYGRNSLIMEETFPDKRILKKLEGEWKSLVFYIATKLKP
jgi:hypothetical protein